MDNFNTIFGILETNYGVDNIDVNDAIDIGLIGWNKIGNRRFKLHKYKGIVDLETKEVELPCNCPDDGIEAVTYDFEDWKYTSNLKMNGDYNSNFTESYIESRKRFQDSFYISGRYVKYDKGPGVIYVYDNIPYVNILYKGPVLDDEGLPYLTEKEAEAIACYIAYTEKFKQGLRTNNAQILQIAQLLKNDWYRLCDAARVRKLNQNDMNEILDVKTSFNRKIFNKAYKPIK